MIKYNKLHVDATDVNSLLEIGNFQTIRRGTQYNIIIL